jgi:hypothetical protein
MATVGEAHADAFDASASPRPSVIDEALIERAASGIWRFLLNAPMEEASATVTAPCPLMTTDEFGWFMGEQGLSPNLDGWAVKVFFEWGAGGAPGIKCGVDIESHLAQVGRGAPHGAIIEALALPTSASFADVLAIAEGAAIIGPGDPQIGGEFGGVCHPGELAICVAMWHRSGLVLNVVLAGPAADVNQTRTVSLLGSMVETIVAGLVEQASAPASAPAVPETTQSSTPPGGLEPAPAPSEQPSGLGTDARMNLLAVACFNGAMQACDDLFDESPAGSAYETFADTCAGRQLAATGRYCADVFSDTVSQDTAPSASPPPTNPGATSTTIGQSAPPVPPTDPDLASRIPVIDGYSIAAVAADDVLWRLFDESLPDGLTRHHALVVAADGAPVAHLVVAAAGAGDRPAIDTFVEHTFADYVYLPAASLETDDGIFTTMNSATPVWTEMEGSAVIVAEQEIDGNFQWAWSADDAVWIVRGRADAEHYVRALLRVHAASLDPHDQQGMTGDLFDHTPNVPGFRYWDRPRASTLAGLSQTLLGDCVERFYAGYVLPVGVTDGGNDPRDLQVVLVKAARRCVDDGFLADVVADVASAPGIRTEQIGGLTVYRDEQNAFFVQGAHGMIAFVGDVIVIVATQDAQTLVDMAPFIERFLAGQPATTAAEPAPTASEPRPSK